LQTSWNSKFLQYAKQQWARQLNQGSQTGGNYAKSGTAQSSNSTASASLDQLLDNDW
jgi:hypothetical protein